MKNKSKKYNKSWVIALMIILPLSIIGLTGCKSKEVVVSQEEETNGELEESASDTTNEQDLSADSLNETLQESETDQETDQETEQVTEQVTEQDTDKEDVLTQLIDLLGLSQKELADIIGEEPKTVDEGGLEFTDYGIRVWFDKNAHVSQIYVLKNDIALNGVKTGDKISAFKEAFGAPVKDNNGDAHFKYGDIYLSVNYDTSTKDTFSVYILKDDF